MKNRWLIGILLILFYFVMQNALASQDLYTFATVQQKNQFYELISELRCLVCQNESLADSNAELAKDLRHEIYVMSQQGKTPAQIKTYLVSRYGNFILFNPPINHQTFFLWAAPLLFLFIGALVLIRMVTRRSVDT